MFETYAQAVEWIRPLWGDVLIPYRLHQREFDEGGGPEMTSAFRRLLEARATETRIGRFMDRCGHPRMERNIRWGPSCPDCDNTGFVEKFGATFKYPMAAALWNLKDKRATSSLHPRPAQLIVLLARNAWDVASTCFEFHPAYAYEMVEALGLIAIRALYSEYSARPRTWERARVGWVSMSEANRAAIMDGEVG